MLYNAKCLSQILLRYHLQCQFLLLKHEAVFHSGLCGGVELRRTCGGVRLGQVGGGGDALEVHRGGIIVPAGALVDLRRVRNFC